MDSNYVYGTLLRHASSAGGNLAADEGWVIKSWYGEIHRMTVDEILTVGVGMSLSQKMMWIMVSMVAYNKGVFPDGYFMDHDGLKIITPDVGNFDVWFLLHEMTRKTYVDAIDRGVIVDWRFHGLADDGSTAWNLVFLYQNGETETEYHHWRGNTDTKARRIREERGYGDNRTDSSSEDTPGICTPETTEDGADSMEHDVASVNDLVADLKIEAEQVNNREEAVAEREVHVIEHKKQLWDRETAVTKREASVAQREYAVAEREKQVLDLREEALVERERQLSSQSSGDLDSALRVGKAVAGLPGLGGLILERERDLININRENTKRANNTRNAAHHVFNTPAAAPPFTFGSMHKNGGSLFAGKQGDRADLQEGEDDYEAFSGAGSFDDEHDDGFGLFF